MARIINKIIVGLLLIGAFVCFNMGMDWVNFGYGFNPWFSIPLAILLCFSALLVHIVGDMSYIPVDENGEIIERRSK